MGRQAFLQDRFSDKTFSTIGSKFAADFEILFCQLLKNITKFRIVRASDISRGRGPAKFRFFREIHQKYFQIHVGKTYFILILAIRPVLFTPNVQIYLETSSLQRANNVP